MRRPAKLFRRAAIRRTRKEEEANELSVPQGYKGISRSRMRRLIKSNKQMQNRHLLEEKAERNKQASRKKNKATRKARKLHRG